MMVKAVKSCNNTCSTTELKWKNLVHTTKGSHTESCWTFSTSLIMQVRCKCYVSAQSLRFLKLKTLLWALLFQALFCFVSLATSQQLEKSILRMNLHRQVYVRPHWNTMFYFTQSQYTDSRPASSSTDPEHPACDKSTTKQCRENIVKCQFFQAIGLSGQGSHPWTSHAQGGYPTSRPFCWLRIQYLHTDLLAGRTSH